MIGLLVALAVLQEPQRADNDARCIDCHKKEADAWKPSVHNANNQGCVACHGTDLIHAAAEKKHAREKTFRAGTKNTNVALCAVCHGEEAKQFVESPHWEDPPDPDAKKLRGCVQCHEYHATVPAARAAILADRCYKCHRKGSEARDHGEKYVNLAGELESEYAKLRELLREPLPGVSYAAAERARDEAEEAYKKMRTRQHSCEFAKLEKEIPPAVPPVQAAIGKLNQDWQSARGKRRWAIAAFLVLMAANLLLARAWCVRAYGKH